MFIFGDDLTMTKCLANLWCKIYINNPAHRIKTESAKEFCYVILFRDEPV